MIDHGLWIKIGMFKENASLQVNSLLMETQHILEECLIEELEELWKKSKSRRCKLKIKTSFSFPWLVAFELKLLKDVPISKVKSNTKEHRNHWRNKQNITLSFRYLKTETVMKKSYLFLLRIILPRRCFYKSSCIFHKVFCCMYFDTDAHHLNDYDCSKMFCTTVSVLHLLQEL